MHSRVVGSFAFLAVGASAAVGLACSVPAGFDWRRPLHGDPVEVDASLIFSGTYQYLGDVSLVDAEGSAVEFDLRVYGTPSFLSGIIVVDPRESIRAGARYDVTLELETSRGDAPIDFEFEFVAADVVLVPAEATAGTFEVVAYYSDDQAWEAGCMRPADQAISLTLSAATSAAPRLVVARSSLGTSAIILPAGAEVDGLLAGVPVSGIDDALALDVFGLDGALLASTTVARPQLCYDLDVAMNEPVPPGGWELALHRSQLEAAARPCDEAGAPIYEVEPDGEVGAGADTGAAGDAGSADDGGETAMIDVSAADATGLPSDRDPAGCAAMRSRPGWLWGLGAIALLSRRARYRPQSRPR